MRLKLVFAIVGFISFAINDWVVVHYLKPQLLTVDSKALERTLVLKLAEKPLTEEKLLQITKRFHEALKTAIQDYAKSHEALIFDKKESLAGGKDITFEMMQKASLLLRKHS